MATFTLLSNQTSNGDGASFTYPGGIGTLVFDGTFDGATVEIKAASQDTGADFNTVKNGTFAVAEPQNVYFGGNTKLKATVTNAGASTDLTVKIVV